MNKQSLTSSKSAIRFIGIFVLALLLSKCESNEPKTFADTLTDTATAKKFVPEFSYAIPPKDVASQSPDASLAELAQFAWLEFVALNWPVESGSRGLPDTTQPNGFIDASQVGTDTYTPVWQTYWHRNEIFPANSQPVPPQEKNSPPPKYQYSRAYKPDPSAQGLSYTLWNNLDEVNELGQDIVFAHSTDSTLNEPYQVLYEAKMNFAGSKYVYDNEIYKSAKRDSLKKHTMNSAANQGICDADLSKYICLPCGDIGKDTEGNIEIKAAWRQLTPEEVKSNSYHIQNVIYYKNVKQPDGSINTYYENAYMGLVGLHIIHKTKTFPTYVFATFEHKDNLSSDIYYDELENTPFGDVQSPKGSYTKIERKHPIPAVIDIINGIVELELANKNSIWQNYKLINVQAKPVDKSSIPTSKEDDPMNSYYYLSNSVIESNIELQTFTGTLQTPNANNVTYQDATTGNPNLVNMGGCMGCHGNAQQAGTDFNFLIAGAPFSAAETTGPQTGCPPGAAATSIQSWADVKAFFGDCAALIMSNLQLSPHGQFWDNGNNEMDKYNNFINGSANTYSSPVKICDCSPGNNPEDSNIIKYLRGKKGSGVPHMPGGGPFYTKAQIDSLAVWIKKGCQFKKPSS